MYKPLQLVDIFIEAISHLWSERKIIGGLLAIVVAIDVALNWFQSSVTDNEDYGWWILVLVIQALVYTLFAVRAHRLILGVANPLQDGFRWKGRETRFFAWLLMATTFFPILGIAILSAVIGASAMVIKADLDDDWLLLILSVFAILPIAYLLGRLMVLLPSAALDQKQNLKWAWTLTKGNGWRLMLLLWGMPTLLVFMYSVLSLDAWFDTVLGSVVLNSVFGVVTSIEVALLSIAFKALGGLNEQCPVQLVTHQ